MTKPTSAVIIPFPRPRLSTPFYGPAAALPPGDRLTTALGSLSSALIEQHRAIQAWRDALADLAASMRPLNTPPRPTQTHAS